MSFSLSKTWAERKQRQQTAVNKQFPNAIPRKEHHAPAKEEQKIIADLQSLLNQGADINARDNLGWTALYRCTIWGYVSAAQFLLEAGASIGACRAGKDDACAEQSAAYNNPALLKLFFDYGATDNERGWTGNNILHAALHGGGQDNLARKTECIDMLLAKGLAFDDPDDARVVFRCFPSLAHHFPGLAEAKELQEAAKAGDTGKAKEMLAKGVKADSAATEYGNDSALFLAAQNGDIPMIELLVDAGADPNLASPDSDTTPLQAAIQAGHGAAFEKLWDLGGTPGMQAHSILSSATRGGPELEAIVKKCIHDEAIMVKKKTSVFKPLVFRQPRAGWGL